jgi:hypothetical protein
VRYVNKTGNEVQFGELAEFEIVHLPGKPWEVYAYTAQPGNITQLQLIEDFENELTAKLFITFLESWQKQGAYVACFHSNAMPIIPEKTGLLDIGELGVSLRDAFETKCNFAVSIENEKDLIFIVIVDGTLSFERIEMNKP